MNTKYFKIIVPLLLCFFALACGDQNTNQEASNEETTVPEKPIEKAPIAEANTLGKRMFILCQACHNLKAGEPHKVGPNLHGMFGLKAGTKEGFNYSDALKSSGIVWDEANLRAWLENPTDFIPGTIMAFVGLKEKKQQDALIEYLTEQTK